jgi:hypothetical protein
MPRWFLSASPRGSLRTVPIGGVDLQTEAILHASRYVYGCAQLLKTCCALSVSATARTPIANAHDRRRSRTALTAVFRNTARAANAGDSVGTIRLSNMRSAFAAISVRRG